MVQADPKNNPMETSGPLFMTLDGRVRFKVVVSWSSTPRPDNYPVQLDLVCSSFPWDNDVRVILHTHLVQLTISLWWPDDDDFMMTIPDYAREFESERDPQDNNVLYRIRYETLFFAVADLHLSSIVTCAVTAGDLS